MIKDSGARTEFESGAVRDIQKGKGRCELLPLDIIERLLGENKSLFLGWVDLFMKEGGVMNLHQAMLFIIKELFPDTETAILELSKHYEEGAEKYDDHNWKRGILLSRYIDSGIRHYLKHLRGDTDEPHDRAVLWNIVGAVWTLEHKPELDDIDHKSYRGDRNTDVEYKTVVKDVTISEIIKEMRKAQRERGLIVADSSSLREPRQLSTEDLFHMKDQSVYFIPYSDEEKPRWIKVVYDFITEANEKEWALYNSCDDFIRFLEIEGSGMVFDKLTSYPVEGVYRYEKTNA